METQKTSAASGRAHRELLSKEIVYARRAVSALSAISPRLGARLTSFLYFFPKKMRSRIHNLRPTPEVLDVPMRTGNTHRFYAWGSGPTVLFIHGWGGCGSQCRSLIEPLVSAGFRLVTFDAPAHGASAQRTTDSFEITECVKQFAAHSRVDAIVAHSFGGLVALRAVGTGLALKSLVLLAPPNPDLVLSKFAEVLRLSDKTVMHHKKFVERRFRSLGVNPWVEFSLPKLASAQARPLVIHDTEDEEVPADEARNVASAVGAVDHVWTNGYGHHRILAAPDAIEATKAFLLAAIETEYTPRVAGSRATA